VNYKLLIALSVICLLTNAIQAETPQYQSGDIVVSGASADEPLRKEFSLAAAKEYLSKGSQAWTENRKCVACHTNGIYMQLAPTLGKMFGEQVRTHRDFFAKEIAKFKQAPLSSISSGIKPTLVAYVAQGLAAWDANNGNQLSAEAKEALDLMLVVQSENGSWGNSNCWPPFESSAYQGATVAALALRTAPGYIKQLNDEQKAKVELLEKYLQSTKPPHDYARVLLLWVSTKWEGLISDQLKEEIIEMIIARQQDDGGWSMRTFATPETWGGGSRLAKLKSEREYEDPPSDGHQTGLAIMILRDAGIKTDRATIQAGIKWIKSNQRKSGRWWTRSLNTDGPHFITYSGTFYALIALHKCGELN